MSTLDPSAGSPLPPPAQLTYEHHRRHRPRLAEVLGLPILAHALQFVDCVRRVAERQDGGGFSPAPRRPPSAVTAVAAITDTTINAPIFASNEVVVPNTSSPDTDRVSPRRAIVGAARPAYTYTGRGFQVITRCSLSASGAAWWCGLCRGWPQAAPLDLQGAQHVLPILFVGRH